MTACSLPHLTAINNARQRRFMAACSFVIIITAVSKPLGRRNMFPMGVLGGRSGGNTNEGSFLGMSSTLDVTGNWDAGDDLRIIEALLVPFGQYTLSCVGNCCNSLEDMSPEAVLRVKALLDEYDAASVVESEQNLSDKEGKVLVKADVLEWEVTGQGVPTGPEQEINKIRMELWNYFAFCPCLAGLNPNNGIGGYGTTALYRS